MKLVEAELARQGCTGVRFRLAGGPGAPAPPEMNGAGPRADGPRPQEATLSFSWKPAWDTGAPRAVAPRASHRQAEQAKAAVAFWVNDASGSYGPQVVKLSALKPEVRSAVTNSLLTVRKQAGGDESRAYSFPGKGGWGSKSYVLVDARKSVPTGPLAFQERFQLLDAKTGALLAQGKAERTAEGRKLVQWDK